MEIGSKEWRERIKKRADELGLNWVEAYDTIFVAQPELNMQYPAFDNIQMAQDSVKSGLRTLELLTSERGPYTFVGRGSSGLFLSTLCALSRPGSDIVWVRKKEDVTAHTGTTGYDKLMGQKPVVLFDDVVCTGTTIKKIQEELKFGLDSGTCDCATIDYLIAETGMWGGSTWKSICDAVKPKLVICHNVSK